MQGFYDLFVNLASEYGYWFMGIAMFLDSVNIPAASEVVLTFGGYMSKVSQMNLYVLIIITTLSTTLGAILNYYIGLWYGDSFIRKFGKYLLISDDDYTKGIKWFEKHGNFAAFFGRLIPGVRTFISLPAGTAKTNIVSFSLWTFAGSAIWCTAFCSIGYVLGAKWKTIEAYLDKFHIIIVIIALALISIYVYNRLKK